MRLGWTVFEAINPRHAAALSCYECTAGSLLEKRHTIHNEETLFDSRGSTPRYLHSPDGALSEAKTWVSAALQDIEEKTDILVLYGLGLGWYWKALLPWLERRKERHLFIIEDDLAVIAHCIESELGDALFSHPKTRVIALSGPDDKENIDLISWNLFRKRHLFFAIPPYLKYRPNAVKIVQDAIQVRAIDIHLVADEFSTFGIQHARNWLRNLLFMNEAYNAQDLFQTWKGLPVIVVAAGPSLQDSLEFLKRNQSRILIIAGGSAINALIEAGIFPHLCVTVDPNPLQYNRMKYLEPFQLPLIFRSRALYEGVLAAHGSPLLYLKGGDGYSFITYCEESLGIKGDTLDGGDSVSTLLIELAAALGASSIIMLGYDLGYVSDQRYPDSMKGLLHQSEGGIKISSNQKSSSMMTAPSNSGKTIQTEAKWIVEGKWIGSFAKDLDSSIQLMNASLNGLKIENVASISIVEVEKFLENLPEEALFSRIFTAIYSCSRLGEGASKSAISEMIRKISDGLIAFESMAEALQLKLQEDEQGEITSGQIQYISDLESSFAFKNLLEPFWRMHTVWHEALLQLNMDYSCKDWKRERKKREKQYLVERLEFIIEGVQSYQRLLFSYVSWSILQGSILEDPLEIAPWPKHAKKDQEPDLQIYSMPQKEGVSP
ncbi:MAG: DUF115 domain-containing protein [Chlamydia sp.]